MDQEETVMASRRLWVKRRRTPRWAILLSWIVGAVVWLANPSAPLVINSLFFVLVATVVAAFAMLLIRLIGRAW